MTQLCHLIGFLRKSSINSTSGTSITPTTSLSYLATYWNAFSEFSPYEVTITGTFTDVLLKTKDGDRIVGAAVRGQQGGMIFVPPIQYDEDAFSERDEESEEEFWNKKARTFGKKLIAALVGVAKSLDQSTGITPPPEWTQKSEFRLHKEDELQALISDKAKVIQRLQEEKLNLEHERMSAGSLRRLLYESGHQLEEAILETLRLLGYKAEPFKEGGSEFDAVFTSPDGRFIGEAEGRDNRAINIDKLSQLERNLQEDFAREGITEYAKGVLFGNPHRFAPIEQRQSPFTDKCTSGAKRSKVALVLTTDLFRVAKYLKENQDSEYARLCREVITKAEGEIVKFPEPPISDSTTETSEDTVLDVKKHLS